ARQKTSALAMLDVLLDKVIPRNAVAIRENQVIAAGSQDRFIENLGFAEAVILVPNMHDRNPHEGLHFLDKACGSGRRTVIGYDKLKIFCSLATVAPKHFFKPRFGVIGTDDDGCFHYTNLANLCPTFSRN